MVLDTLVFIRRIFQPKILREKMETCYINAHLCILFICISNMKRLVIRLFAEWPLEILVAQHESIQQFLITTCLLAASLRMLSSLWLCGKDVNLMQIGCHLAQDNRFQWWFHSKLYSKMELLMICNAIK